MAPNLKPVNDNRPAGYDAQVVSFRPLVRRIAHGWCAKHPANGEPDDVIQDVMAEAFKRGHLYDPKYKFGLWMAFLCRVVISRRLRELRAAKRDRRSYRSMETVTPTQDDHVELSQVIARLSGRGGEFVLRAAMGEELHEIGATVGLTKQRVSQLAKVERRRLVQSLNTVRMAA